MFNKSSALNFLLFGLASTIAEEKLPLTHDAIMETYHEYTIQPWKIDARKKLGLYSFKTAVAYNREKKYKKAAIGCYWALSFDPLLRNALLLLEYLKTNHSEELDNVSQLYE